MSQDSVPAIVLYGASGYARGFALMRSEHSALEPAFRIAAYIDDFRGDEGLHNQGVPVITFETWQANFRELPCLVTVSDPSARRRLVQRIQEAGGTFLSVFPRGTAISPDLVLGEGSTIHQFCFVGPSVLIGRHVQVGPLSSLGHDVNIGDFVTICPSVNISGYVNIEDDVFVGAGAVIVNGLENRWLRIGRGAMVYAGAVVTKNVAPGAKVAGNPAQDIRSFISGREKAGSPPA